MPLAPEAVQSASLSLQSVHHVHSCDGFPLGVLAVGHCISDDVLKEDFQNAARFLVDQPGDSLDTPSSSQATDCRFSDALDVVSQDFAVTFGTALSKPLSSFACSGHCWFVDDRWSQGEYGDSSDPPEYCILIADAIVATTENQRGRPVEHARIAPAQHSETREIR